jgi:hypothetical protein
MFDRIKALLARWHEVKEIEALTERDLDDLGMSRDQVRAFLTMPRDLADRVAAMGAIFGIPEVELKRDHGLWLDLLDTCGHCCDRGACAVALSQGDVTHPRDCGFCPNHASFTDLATRQSSRQAA